MCRKGRLTNTERTEKGALKGRVYVQYLAAMEWVTVAALLAALLGGQVALVMSEWWLAEWASSPPAEQRSELRRWLGVYTAIVACARFLSSGIRSFLGFFWILLCAKNGLKFRVCMLQRW